MIPHAPGVQMQPIPEDAIADVSDNEDDTSVAQPDKRISIMSRDKRIACDEEFSDSEDEGDGRRDIRGHKRKRPRPEEDGAGKEGESKGKNMSVAVLISHCAVPGIWLIFLQARWFFFSFKSNVGDFKNPILAKILGKQNWENLNGFS